MAFTFYQLKETTNFPLSPAKKTKIFEEFSYTKPQANFYLLEVPTSKISGEKPPEQNTSFSLLPSYAALSDNDYSFCFILEGRKEGDNESKLYKLTPVGTKDINPEPFFNGRNLYEEAGIDVFTNLKEISCVYLLIRTDEGGTFTDNDMLLSFSVLTQENHTYRAPSKENVLLDVEPISQKQQDKDIGHRICSPVSISMVLKSYKIETTPLDIARLAYSQKYDLYGIWPQNIWAASRYGVLGLVTSFSSYEHVEKVLKQNIPIIATLTYKEGELTGAPMRKTKGHLMVLKGISDKGIIVNDPAADQDHECEKYYDPEEFYNAWIKNKQGISYVLLSP